jgi:Tfp pilus assembly protein PilO
MTKSRTWTVGTAVLVVLILLAGWFLLVTPKRSHAADLQAQATSAKAANLSTAGQIKALQAQQQKLPAAESQLSQFKVQIPANPQLPAFIRSLESAATASGVYLTSISPANPTAMTSAAAAPAPAPTASASAASGSAAATAPAAAAPQSTVVPGLNSGVYNIEAQLVVAGSYAGLEAFEHQLEGMQRSVLVHTISISSCNNGSGSSSGSGAGAGGLSCTAASVAALSDPLAMSIDARIFLDPNLGQGGGGSATGAGLGN